VSSSSKTQHVAGRKQQMQHISFTAAEHRQLSQRTGMIGWRQQMGRVAVHGSSILAAIKAGYDWGLTEGELKQMQERWR